MTDIKYSAESGITLIAVVIVVVVTHIKESSESCDVVEAVDVEERLEMLILQEGCGRTRVRSQQEMNDEKDEETGRRAQKEERLAGLVQVITSGFKGWGGMREKWRLYERKETQNYPYFKTRATTATLTATRKTRDASIYRAHVCFNKQSRAEATKN